MSIKGMVAGTLITLVIGGTAYNVSQKDVATNFANDTGMTQQQAEQYVQNVSDDDLVPYAQVGTGFISDGNQVLSAASQLDCVNYTYAWETTTLTCVDGKAKLIKIGNDEIALGNSYVKLGSSSASKTDMSVTVNLIDEVNVDYGYEIVAKFLDAGAISEAKNTNSYNKATLEAALQANQ